MELEENDCPFTPGAGNEPPLLAGRDRETRLLGLMLKRLDSLHPEKLVKKARSPLAPIKIVGPRGVGKTALLTWAENEAKKRKIRFVACDLLKPKAGQDPMRNLMERIAGDLKSALKLLKTVSLSVVNKVGGGIELRQAEDFFTDVTEDVVKKQPLLLVLDEVHHYDLDMLTVLLQGSHRMIRRGHPLGVILAGTPMLDGHLRKAESTFIVRSEEIYINALSDDATRKALLTPFEDAGIKVTPAALKAMVAETDNYPFFIQHMGKETWNEMVAAGSKSVNFRLVAKSKKLARARRASLYALAYENLGANGLLPHAKQVLELVESKGGKVPLTVIVDALIEANPGMDHRQAYEITYGLREDGFIWTVAGRTSPGIPSFFDYFKAEEKEAGRY